MQYVLWLVYGAFAVVGLLVAARGLKLTAEIKRHPTPDPRTEAEAVEAARRKSLPVLMFVVAVPLVVFGAAGIATLAVVATH